MEKLIYKARKEKQEITAPVLLPEQTDAHGDIYSIEEVEKACRNFNENCMQTNLQHIYQMSEDTTEVIESWVTKSDQVIDDVTIPKGTWMMTMKIKSPALWKAVKDGEFTGFSIGAHCKAEKLNVSE